jgi:hypothetical protein
MATQDEAMQNAVADQINAELAARDLDMKKLATMLGRPYDSTRNYLKKERAMPLAFLLETATALGIPADIIVARARDQQLEKYL